LAPVRRKCDIFSNELINLAIALIAGAVFRVAQAAHQPDAPQRPNVVNDWSMPEPHCDRAHDRQRTMLPLLICVSHGGGDAIDPDPTTEMRQAASAQAQGYDTVFRCALR
jgi:hypothetical protein